MINDYSTLIDQCVPELKDIRLCLERSYLLEQTELMTEKQAEIYLKQHNLNRKSYNTGLMLCILDLIFPFGIYSWWIGEPAAFLMTLTFNCMYIKAIANFFIYKKQIDKHNAGFNI